MMIFEFGPPFQWKPSYTKFGQFRRVMWAWFAVTHFGGGNINELLESIGRAGVRLAMERGVVVRTGKPDPIIDDRPC